MKGIDKKRVFVTGAVQGIGRAVAERFLSEGASVLLTDAAPAEVIHDVVDSLEDRYPGSLPATMQRTSRARGSTWTAA
jgi:NAD(P)-dependent dehydrogenase (short-subunit alcohol dehydrogenase family)